MLGSFHVLEEGGQLRQALPEAIDAQRGIPIRFGILEVEADTLTSQPSVSKAAKGRHDGGAAMASGSRQVEAIRPLAKIVRVLRPARYSRQVG